MIYCSRAEQILASLIANYLVRKTGLLFVIRMVESDGNFYNLQGFLNTITLKTSVIWSEEEIVTPSR